MTKAKRINTTASVKPATKIVRRPGYVEVKAGETIGRIYRASEDQLFQAIMIDCLELYTGIDTSRPDLLDSIDNLRAAIRDAGLLEDVGLEDEAEQLAKLPADDAAAELVELAAKCRDTFCQPGRYRVLTA